jgi:UDP-N-acetyl-D-galactosamine dehydrogenase
MIKKICIIGLGYVGLPLAAKLSNHYQVYGFDKSKSRVKELKKKFDKNNELKKKDLINLNKNNLFSKPIFIKKNHCDVYIITVPTPIKKNKNPDLKPIIEATNLISKIVKGGEIIVYESTVYPSLTEDKLRKIIEKNSKINCAYSDKNFNKGFSLAYSPERINPGDKYHQIQNITKVISGTNSKCVSELKKIYSKLNNGKIFVAKNIKTAEAAKIIENIQRDLNIALVNELSVIFEKMNINIYDVLDAASTKWNFHKYLPGLVGGHCIGVDPYYLTFKAKSLGIKPRVILSGRNVNDKMSSFYATKISRLIKNKTKSKKILIMGFAFKENVSDIRNTKVYDLYKNLKKYHKKIDVFDPVVNANEVKKEYNLTIVKKPIFKNYNCIIFAVSHNKFKNFKINNIKKNNNNILVIQIKKIFENKKVDFTF